MNDEELSIFADKCYKALTNFMQKKSLTLKEADIISDSIFCTLLMNSISNVPDEKKMDYVKFRFQELNARLNLSVKETHDLFCDKCFDKQSETIH